MIQDIYPHKLDNSYRAQEKPATESIIISITSDGVLTRILEGDDIKSPEEQICTGDKEKRLLSTAREIELPRLGELSGVDEDKLIYLFALDGTSCFLLSERLKSIPDGYEYIPVTTLRKQGIGPKSSIFSVVTAFQLANWYRKNRYCGCCGSETVRDELERAIRCPSCGNVVYPKIVPAVIVGVINGDKLLITRYAKGFRPFALVAGFTEIGESLEQTVEREVMEEVGLKVKNIRYYKSQPWGIVDDILMGYYCDVDGSTEINMDRLELGMAEWRGRDEIELQPDDFSLTNEMMLRFKRGESC